LQEHSPPTSESPPQREKLVRDDLELLLACLPHRVVEPLRQRPNLSDLLEVVLDLGRLPEARFPDSDLVLDYREISQEDLDYVIQRVGDFGEDNRAGIERTLHRISVMRNRKGRILGVTCRVGRAVFGTIRIIEDLVFSGKSILLLGRPGVGKTTMLREVARVLAETARRRVIVVDTSNEIAGDGDIPHPAIGRARRMQVASPSQQHNVMIEAVENHMPQVIIIDEMGTELEAAAARTIAERGVQLVATAHGNTLDNLILNPTLSDLVGGIQSVTLGDEEARARGTQKTVLERKAPPTFEVVVEIQSWDKVAVHDDVAKVVDAWLRGYPLAPEVRSIDDLGRVRKERHAAVTRDVGVSQQGQGRERKGYKRRERESARGGRRWEDSGGRVEEEPEEREVREIPGTRVFPFGVGRDRIEQAADDLGMSVDVVNEMRNADLILTTKTHYKRGARLIHSAEQAGKPVYVVRKNSASQVQQVLRSLQRNGSSNGHEDESLEGALQETHEAARRVLQGEEFVDLAPQRAYIRRLQHLLADQYNLSSTSSGADPNRHVRLMSK